VSEEYIEFVAKFKILTGIDLSHYNQAQVFRRLSVFQNKHGFSTFKELISNLGTEESLLQECLNKLTINVTGFFRDKPYWDVLKSNITDLTKQRLPLRIWSAGCATGEEAYSLAYMVSNMLPKSCWMLAASDLDSNALSLAKAGLYRFKSLKGLDSQLIHSMFNKINDDLYQVKEQIHGRVNFFQNDLLQDPYPTGLDIVLCRNVIIYFREASKKAVFKKIAQSLNPGGLLFVGGSEQIMSPEELGLIKENIFFYRKPQ